MIKLVLLPGMDGTGRLFEEFVASFPDQWIVEIVSYPANLNLSFAQLVSLLKERLPSGEPFVLLAESFSSPLAIHFASANPGNLICLILCSGFASSPIQTKLCRVFSFLAPVLFTMPLPAFAVKRLLLGPDSSKDRLVAVQAAIASVRVGVLVGRLRMIFACDVRAELQRIRVPVLFLHGTGDRLIPGRCFDDIQQLRPATRIVAMGGPHLLPQRYPEETAKIVAQFISQLA